MKIDLLITCPPMIVQIDNFIELFNKNNINYFIPNFTATVDENELVKLITKFDAWIAGDDLISDKVLKIGSENKLKTVVKWGVGTDNIDYDACKKYNINISHTPNMFGEEVSDVAIGYLLCLSRKLHTIHIGNLNNKWLKPSGDTLVNKKLCLIGFGNIGKCIAKKLIPFELDIWVYDPMYQKNNLLLDKEFEKLKIDSFENCIEKSEYIITCCSLSKSSFHMINKNSIKTCKKGVKIINVGRGSLVNESDICDLLEEQFVDSVAFDVFENEPLDINNKLRLFPQNIFGSHNGSNTVDAVLKTSYKSIDIILNYFNQLITN
jgi:D-3-phosphoglycerate dehydrogenase / 2-oxoglutarate reductase